MPFVYCDENQTPPDTASNAAGSPNTPSEINHHRCRPFTLPRADARGPLPLPHVVRFRRTSHRKGERGFRLRPSLPRRPGLDPGSTRGHCGEGHGRAGPGSGPGLRSFGHARRIRCASAGLRGRARPPTHPHKSTITAAAPSPSRKGRGNVSAAPNRYSSGLTGGSHEGSALLHETLRSSRRVSGFLGDGVLLCQSPTNEKGGTHRCAPPF